MRTKDAGILTEWMVISKDESGKVFMPWDEIDIRMALTNQAAQEWTVTING
jgi:hypothetical protein